MEKKDMLLLIFVAGLSVVRSCKDLSSLCQYYEKRFCDFNWWMQDNCKYTCGFCVGETLGSARVQCGLSFAPVQNGIVGGTTASQGAWPWQVQYSFRNYRHWCGGSILNERWIVTAAHCVQSSTNPSNYKLTVGEHDLSYRDSQEQTISIEKIIIHPEYSPSSSYDSDIALMKLKSNIKFNKYVRPVCLTPREPQVGRECYVTGWGALSESGSGPQVLQQAKVPIVSRSQCQGAYTANTISDRMICAGYAAGGIDACQGDSGGPLVCKSGRTWYLSGIVSWGIGCARPNKYGVYTNVNAVKDWIQQYTE